MQVDQFPSSTQYSVSKAGQSTGKHQYLSPGSFTNTTSQVPVTRAPLEL